MASNANPVRRTGRGWYNSLVSYKNDSLSNVIFCCCYSRQSAHFVVDPIRIDVTKVLGNWLF